MNIDEAQRKFEGLYDKYGYKLFFREHFQVNGTYAQQKYINESSYGLTDTVNKNTHIKSHLTGIHRLRTTVHELGHVILHDGRSDYSEITIPSLDLEAEAFAWIVLFSMGFDMSSLSIPYMRMLKGMPGYSINPWTDENPKRVTAAVEKVFNDLELNFR